MAQKKRSKSTTTKVTKSTIPGEINFQNIPFVHAHPNSYYDLTNKEPRNPRVIVIHSMESQEKLDTAENVAKWLSTQNDKSVHYCIDSDSIIQCLQTRDVAWGCKGMNRCGIQLELAGKANQDLAGWSDDYSEKTLINAAKLCAFIICPKFGIHFNWLSPQEITNINIDESINGFTTHVMVSKTLNIPGGHTDPGKAFPLNHFMELVRYWSNKR